MGHPAAPSPSSQSYSRAPGMVKLHEIVGGTRDIGQAADAEKSPVGRSEMRLARRGAWPLQWFVTTRF